VLITREQVEERLQTLREQLDQLKANANAVIGAVQDCEHWLAVLESESPKPDGEEGE